MGNKKKIKTRKRGLPAHLKEAGQRLVQCKRARQAPDCNISNKENNSILSNMQSMSLPDTNALGKASVMEEAVIKADSSNPDYFRIEGVPGTSATVMQGKKVVADNNCSKIMGVPGPTATVMEERQIEADNIYSRMIEGVPDSSATVIEEAQIKDDNLKLNNFRKENASTGTAIEDDVSNRGHGHGNLPKSAVAVKGRRLVDIDHFIEQLKVYSGHCEKFGCTLKNMDIVSEVRTGLISKFTLQCNYCNSKHILSTDNARAEHLDVNKCAISGTMSIGAGFSQMEEFLSAVDVPSMSGKLYTKLHSVIAEKWQEASIESMIEAAAEERDAALAEGRVNKNGIPMIDVIVDGCWGKRSYRTNYSSLSGAAAIIGRRFGKVLFLSIRNKYCCICARSDKKNVAPRDHKCFKNYTGSSTGMESDILLEGFKESVQAYNLIYARLISDGDSSTYSKILEARPYMDHTVEKIECRNHLLRNFCTKLRGLTIDTRYPIKLRKIISMEKILSLRKAIKASIKYNKNSNDSLSVQIQNLHTDIINSPYHVFGNHDKCKAYFCSSAKTGDSDLSQALRGSPLWLRVILMTSNIGAHARSLIHDVDSNSVEGFNGVIAKFVGGKRVNFSLKQSYQTRCFGAAVSFNTKSLLSNIQRKFHKRPTSILEHFEEKRLKRLENSRRHSRKKNRLHGQVAKNEEIHGVNVRTPDISMECFEKIKKEFLNNLADNIINRKNIEKETILQRDSAEWLQLRRNMLTASSFGSVIKRKTNISCGPLVKTLLNPKNLINVKSIRHGVDNESVALQQLAAQENVVINPCGLFIDEKHPFLGATPDGVTEDMVVEIKCPITAHRMGLDEAINKKKVNFWKVKNGLLAINEQHQWYYQIQGQLHITGKKMCLFGVWSGKSRSIKVEYVRKDDDFWAKIMEPKLVRFYLDCMLPEILDSRLARNMPIKDPPYIIDAINDKKKIKKAQIINSNDTDHVSSASNRSNIGNLTTIVSTILNAQTLNPYAKPDLINNDCDIGSSFNFPERNDVVLPSNSYVPTEEWQDLISPSNHASDSHESVIDFANF